MFQYSRIVLLFILLIVGSVTCLAADSLPPVTSAGGIILLVSGLIGGLGLFEI